MNFDLVRRRMPGQKFAIDGQFDVRILVQRRQRKREGHVAELEMMAVGLAIGGHIHQLVMVPLVIKGAGQPFHEPFAICEQAFKRDGLRNGRVVKENRQRTPRRQLDEIRHRGIHVRATDVLPLVFSRQWPHPVRLKGRQDREFEAEFGEHVECFVVRRGFRQP